MALSCKGRFLPRATAPVKRRLESRAAAEGRCRAGPTQDSRSGSSGAGTGGFAAVTAVCFEAGEGADGEGDQWKSEKSNE